MPANASLPEFKGCAVCKQQWPTRDTFLNDPAIQLAGYQVNFIELTEGFFLFHHSCNNTLGIPARAFLDLYDGELFEERAPTGECPGKCLDKTDLSRCQSRCECVFVREIMQVIEGVPKEHGTPDA